MSYSGVKVSQVTQDPPVVWPHGSVSLRGGAISVGLIAGMLLVIEVSYRNESQLKRSSAGEQG